MHHLVVSTAAIAGVLCAPSLALAQDAQLASPAPTEEVESTTAPELATEDPSADDTTTEAEPAAANGWEAPASKEPPPPRVAMKPGSSGAEATNPVDLERKARRSRARGLMIGGWTTFGATYAGSLTAGVIGIDLADGNERQRKWGRRMAIPVGGPIAAAFVTDSATGTLFTALSSVAQTAGVVMGIAGTVMVVRQKREPRLSFGVAPSKKGVRMGATFRF